MCFFFLPKDRQTVMAKLTLGVPSSWVVLPSSWNDVWEFGFLPEWRNQVISWVLTAPVNSSFMKGRKKGWKAEWMSLQGVGGHGPCVAAQRGANPKQLPLLPSLLPLRVWPSTLRAAQRRSWSGESLPTSMPLSMQCPFPLRCSCSGAPATSCPMQVTGWLVERWPGLETWSIHPSSQ